MFKTATLGAVAHPVNILHEYLGKFNRRQKCKAAILTYMDTWQQSKREQGKDEWVRIVVSELAEQIGYHPETIHLHLHQLLELGLIERKPANWFKGDKAYAYRICPERVLEFLEMSATKPLPENPSVIPGKSESHTRKTRVHLKYNLNHLKENSPPTPSQEGNQREELREEVEEKPEEVIEVSYTAVVDQENDSHHQPETSKSDKHSEARANLARREEIKPGYPDGPWLDTDRRLRLEFVVYIAKLWCKGDTLNSKAFEQMGHSAVKAKVRSHYARPENWLKLENDWEAFVEGQERYIENVQARVEAGCSIPEQEQPEVMETAERLSNLGRLAGLVREAVRRPIASIAPRKSRSLKKCWNWEAAREAVNSNDPVLSMEAAKWATACGGEVVWDRNGKVLEIWPAF
ncbi:MAG TPA: hypothetical protein V6D26_08625 [Stenomitos sp.]